MHDPNVARKNHVIEQIRQRVFAPKIIEFSSSGLCNRKCIFCPRSSEDYNHINSHIETGLIKKISNELAEAKNDYFFLFSGFSEPLLSKDLESWISILQKDHPNSRIEINTNTDLLTVERIHSLFEAGLTSIICSIYDSEERLREVARLIEEAGVPNNQRELRPRFLRKDKDGQEALKDFGITLSNRGGTMKSAGYRIESLSEPLNNPCFYPFYTLFMDFDGDYLLCPHDWDKTTVLGNAKDTHILTDIWHGSEMDRYRTSLLESDRTCGKACSVCDVEGTLMGGAEVKDWKQWTQSRKH